MLLFVQNFTFPFSPCGLRQGRRQEQGPLPHAPLPAVRGAASSTRAAAAEQVALPVPPGRDWEVLDACIDADDMRLVGRTYQFLSDRGILANFGKCKNIVLEGPREVTPTVLKEMAVLEAAKLAPKSISGNSPYVLVAFLGGVSYLLTQGIDIRPNLTAILALATADAIFLGATCLAQISCFWPPYKRRILVHQAGHLLTGYVLEKKSGGKDTQSLDGGVSNFVSRAEFQNIIYWNHDTMPSAEDPLPRCFHWLTIANAMHKPVTAEELANMLAMQNQNS